MNKNKKSVSVFFAVIMAIMSTLMFVSCEQDSYLEINDQVASNQKLRASPKATYYGMEIVGGSPFSDHYMHGIPNVSVYKFWIANPSGITKASVMFSIPSGGTVTLPMTKNSAGNYYLQKTLSEGGRYSVKYVLEKTNMSTYEIPGDGYVYNTRVDFSGEIKKLVWPFGADGSSWNNRSGYQGQLWKGGQEGGPGNGWGQGYHTGNKEQYSDDWNRGTGNQDFGAEIRSPLDGYVESVDSYYVQSLNEYSKYVSVQQIAPNGTTYRFYVSHLNTQNVSVGQYVQAGKTKIGTLGDSGAESPHAHCNLRINGVNGNSVKFRFNAP